MQLDRAHVRRHRWAVIALILIGALMVLLAAGSLLLMRDHIGSVSFEEESHEALLAEVDYRLTMGGFTVLACNLGLFLFFIAMCLEISFRQKAIIVYMARRERQREGEEDGEA